MATPRLEKKMLKKGFFFHKERDRDALEHEKEILRNLEENTSLFARLRGYLSLTGPGWLQSALTLGAGTAGSLLFAGSLYGYKLLWVQPVGMLFGVIVLSAIGHHAIHTQARPYDAFWKKLHPLLAIFWGINVLIAAVIWQFPQYSMGTAMMKDMFKVLGLEMPSWPVALVLLFIATAICWSYGLGIRKYMLWFEKTLKYLVWLMVIVLLAVVIKTGVIWGECLKGFTSFYFPKDVRGITIVLGILGATIGVNMTFLYPYSLLARGWEKEHQGLKNFDLAVSTFLPAVIVPSLLVMATANTLYTQGIEIKNPIDVAHTLEPLIGLTTARIVFGIGILSICISTMTLEMLICGFVLSEMFNFELHGRIFRIATMVANVGIIGAFYALPFWLPVIAGSLNLIMMPIAFICFFILHNRPDYLGDAVTKGFKGYIWNLGILVAILIMALGAWAKLFSIF